MKRWKVILPVSLLVVAISAVAFLLLTQQPMIKLVRFIVFNSFELEGEQVGDVRRDIVYKTVDGNSLMLDLYMPLEKRHDPVPVVVFSHGGGWVMGDRETMFVGPDNEQLVNGLRERGYAIANFEYLVLGEGVTLADMVADNIDVIRWLRKNSADMGLDPDNIGAWGQSAGAHLVLVAGLADSADFPGAGELAGVSAHLNYIVNNYGPADLALHFQSILEGEPATGMQKTQVDFMFGDSLDDGPAEFIASLGSVSPVALVDANNPPVLIVHGEADTLVSIDESLALERALKEHGVSHEAHYVPGADHIFNGATDKQIEEIVSRTIDFIESNYAP